MQDQIGITFLCRLLPLFAVGRLLDGEVGDFDSVVVCRSGFGVGRGVELVDGSAGSTAEEAADFPWLGGVANESSFDRHVAVKFGLSLREVTCDGKTIVVCQFVNEP